MHKRRQLSVAVALGFALLLGAGCGKPSRTQISIDDERVNLIRSEISEGTGGSVAAVTRPDPQGWATLRGTFKVTPSQASKFTTLPTLQVSGDDANFCRQGGLPKSKAMLVKPTGEIENVVVFLDDDLRKMENQELWVHPSKAPGANTEPVKLDQNECVFLSPITLLQVSQPLLVLNSDGVAHNTKPVAGVIPPGGSDTYQHTKQERTPYAVSCNIHPWMLAYVLPRENGYFAQTNPDGEFVIENLPAEVELTIKFWHEKAKFLKNVTINGEPVQTGRGYKIKLPADGEVKLDIVADASNFEGN